MPADAHRALVGRPDRELRLLAGDATHQHYKGGLYRLVGDLRDADTGETVLGRDGAPRVLYQHCHPHARDFWVRDAAEFFGSTHVPDGFGEPHEVSRFRRLG